MFGSFIRTQTRSVFGALCVSAVALATATGASAQDRVFDRIASYNVFENAGGVDQEAAAEIVVWSERGAQLVYTDGEQEAIGFVRVGNAKNPRSNGLVAVGGEPTSVAVVGRYALAGVNTSPDFINPSGKLVVIDVYLKKVVAEYDLPGQPDAVAVSPDGQYAAIAIENERDEDLGEGRVPQLPAGSVVIVDITPRPGNYTLTTVDVTGLADIAPEDPEPEYVDISEDNTVLVTLQENNHIILIDAASKAVTGDFSAGTVDLDGVDTEEEGIIDLTASLTAVPREPDGANWINDTYFATANEGDMDGGSRGFTVWNKNGTVVYDSGVDMERLVSSIGHYPDERSGNKGNEPENIEVGTYGGVIHMFVGSERSSVVAVYTVNASTGIPTFKQVLPTGLEPEGMIAIPSRNLFVAASEEDARDDKFRSQLNIFRMFDTSADYPTLQSVDRANGNPIPWGALSGLDVSNSDATVGYTVIDSFYADSRILTHTVTGSVPETITAETAITRDGAQASLDLEGVAHSTLGGWWVVSEGNADTTENLLVKVAANGAIENEIALPADIAAKASRFGFEGVEEVADEADAPVAYVAVQREWTGDPDGSIRIGRYDGTWKWAYYPKDTPTSANGGWVGLADLAYGGNGVMWVLERDNQGGADATIKRIYQINLNSVTFTEDTFAATAVPTFQTFTKTLVRDLIAEGDFAKTGGVPLEKVEGLLVTDNNIVVVNDNDGVDDSNGETQVMVIKR